MPIVPSVAMNANASGMPPKFAATPEKVVMPERIQRGVPSRIDAYAMPMPSTPPSTDVTRLTLTETQYEPMYGCLSRSWRLEIVQPPCAPLNAPTSTSPAGRKRNRSAYAKNGSVPTHARERRLRPDTKSGRSALDAASVASYAPIFVGHCCAISVFAAVCCPLVANLIFA